MSDEERSDLTILRQLAERIASGPERDRALGAAQAIEASLARLAAQDQMEAAVRRREREQQLILDSVPAMIWFKDRHNRILRCNRSAADSLRRAAAELEGANVAELYPEEAARYLADDLEVITTGRPKLGIIEPYQTGTEKIWVRTDKVPFEDDEGNIVGVVVFAVDITPLKQAEDARARALAVERQARAAAEEANRAKDGFLATISHELRTPLTAILGYAALLREGKLDAAGQERAVRSIERNAKTQTRLVEDLLDVSRMIADKIGLDVGPVDLEEVLREVTESGRLAAAAKSIELHFDVRGEVSLVLGDPARIRQVFDNLLTNAVKFTPAGGRIDVLVEPTAEGARVVVRDNGIGIPADALPRIFERFWQADSSPTRGHGGLGIGLTVVRHIVELHGGTVHATSLGSGCGSVFTVELPRRPPRAER
jgi:PAS domain S-box-containing protein